MKFNIKKFYMVMPFHFYVLCEIQNKQQPLPYTTLRDWFFISDVESVYSAVRSDFLYKTDTLRL
jgi:hypothetical protein